MRDIETRPLISVIIPVYNARNFFEQAIDSIIRQTYINWELIIVDDCSTDESAEVACAYARRDSRIRVFKTDRRLPVGAVANLALKKARGQFIARMDADDVALPDRLADQLHFLQAHPQVIGVGGQCELIDEDDNVLGYRRFPVHPKEVEEMMFYNYPVQSPTFMVRASALPRDFVWYEDKVESAEEHELLFKLRQYGEIANVPEVTLQYRIHSNNTSRQHPKRDFFHIFGVRFGAILKYGYIPSFLGFIKSIGEVVVISLTPEKMMYPAYLYYKRLLAHANVESKENWASWYQ